MNVRKETFGKNRALIEKEWGEKHRKETGQELHSYFYPDNGTNIYSDSLPYNAWIKINNHQRCHEYLTGNLPTLFTASFIAQIWFPNLTLGFVGATILFRHYYIKGYKSFRGHNRATIHEEFIKLTLVSLLALSFASSFRIMGLGRNLNLKAWWQKKTPKPLKKVSSSRLDLS